MTVLFWKAAGAVLLTAVLTAALGKQERDMAAVLSMSVCCMVGILSVSYLEPVLDFLRELERLGNLQNGMLGCILKAVGIGLVAELAGMLCADTGNGSLGKILQMLGSAAILYLSIPLFQSLLALIQEIIGGL